ncbi:MAG: hypothetical protein RDU20_07500 [Desulfomonilaceae bacterium]|nr:hypothetical protein [Desulfomonilaceae bacterium]
MRKTFLYVAYFCFLAALGILLGCYIHAVRVNQTTVMSGVAFVRELPYGELIVGYTETMVFSYQERKALDKFRKEHEGKIEIDPKVLEQQKKLFGADPDRP